MSVPARAFNFQLVPIYLSVCRLCESQLSKPVCKYRYYKDTHSAVLVVCIVLNLLSLYFFLQTLKFVICPVLGMGSAIK